MSDITRDDLRVTTEGSGPRAPLYRKVSDEEFDRLAREAGYIPVKESLERMEAVAKIPGVTMLGPHPLDWIAEHPGKALRALLADKCDRCHGNGQECWSCITGQNPTHTDHGDQPCPRCDGRGWLPKDGVRLYGSNEWDDEPIIAFPVDWLEAEDE